jgi:hypothetical protein
MRAAIRSGAARDLVMFRHAGLVTTLRVHTRGDVCPSCAQLADRRYSLRDAVGVLPNTECESSVGWCDVVWAAERRRRPR